MKLGMRLALIGLASLSLAACGKKEPSGQVIATVGGDEITAIDLRNEMKGFSATDPAVRKAAERQALENIVARRVLAKAAKKAKIDKSPDYAQQEGRVKEALLVQVWQTQLADSVPAPSTEEIQRFIDQHPDYYAAHKIWTVDQIRMPRVNNPTVLEGLRPLKTLPEIEAFLTANKIPSTKGATQVDVLTLPPELLTQIQKLPPGEIFVLPAQNLLLVNQIRETREVPFTGSGANNHARQFLLNTRKREVLQRQFGSLVQQGKKDVKYAKGFEPPAPPKAGSKPPAKAAPAAAPAAPAAKPG
jgi:peptidyl-prolyl cis-trans isomerase C